MSYESLKKLSNFMCPHDLFSQAQSHIILIVQAKVGHELHF